VSDENGVTPLQAASGYGFVSVVQILAQRSRQRRSNVFPTKESFIKGDLNRGSQNYSGSFVNPPLVQVQDTVKGREPSLVTSISQFPSPITNSSRTQTQTASTAPPSLRSSLLPSNTSSPATTPYISNPPPFSFSSSTSPSQTPLASSSSSSSSPSVSTISTHNLTVTVDSSGNPSNSNSLDDLEFPRTPTALDLYVL